MSDVELQEHSQMELHEQVDRVADQASFLAFAALLRGTELLRDRQKPQVRRHAMARMLKAGKARPSRPSWKAAVSWAEDSDFGARQGLASASPWKQFAVFLYAVKIYE